MKTKPNLTIMAITAEDYWKKKKERLKQKYPTIREKDLIFREGEEREMIEMLGYKLGKTQQDLLLIIAGL